MSTAPPKNTDQSFKTSRRLRTEKAAFSCLDSKLKLPTKDRNEAMEHIRAATQPRSEAKRIIAQHRKAAVQGSKKSVLTKAIERAKESGLSREFVEAEFRLVTTGKWWPEEFTVSSFCAWYNIKPEFLNALWRRDEGPKREKTNKGYVIGYEGAEAWADSEEGRKWVMRCDSPEASPVPIESIPQLAPEELEWRRNASIDELCVIPDFLRRDTRKEEMAA